MAEINANIVVEPIALTVTQDNTNLGVTVDTTSLNLFTTVAQAGGSNTEILYNNNGAIAGIPITTFDGNNLTLGDSSNVKLNGGDNGYFLQTDGSGNLTWAQGTANVSGNGTAAGANGAVQFSDGTGNFVADSGFNYDSVLNKLTSVSMQTSNFTVTNLFWTPPNTATILGNAATGGNSGTAYGFNSNASGVGTVALGTSARSVNANSISIGTIARAEGTDSISIGKNAGNGGGFTGSKRIAIGSNAGFGSGVGIYSFQIAIGNDSGKGQETAAIAIGDFAGGNNQSQFAVALGYNAGLDNQGQAAIAIGKSTGNNQGDHAIAIGPIANAQATNSIALNASGVTLTANTANAFFVDPIRQIDQTSLLGYNTTTKEITHSPFIMPNYANTTARDAAVPTPSTGQIVFTVDIAKFQGWDGSAWANLN